MDYARLAISSRIARNSVPKAGFSPASARARARAGQGGQATLEYILLLAVILSVALGMSRTMTTGLDKGIRRFGAQLEKDLKTGRAPAGVWQN